MPSCWNNNGIKRRTSRCRSIAHVLTPIRFALVSSYVELVPEDEAAMIADDGTGAEYNYGEQGFP